MSQESVRGLTAVFDQILVSGTNFITTALVGRLAGAEVLGLFAIGFSVIVIFASGQRSLLVTPYAVFVHRHSSAEQLRMRGATLVFACMITIAFVAMLCMLLAGWWLFSAEGTEASMLWLAVAVICAVPAWTLREFARQLSFSDLKFRPAVVVDGIQAAIQLSALACLVWLQRVTATNVMFAIAVASAIAGMVWLAVTWNQFEFVPSSWRDQWQRTWRFGRWGALSQTSHVIQGYALSWILAATGGLGAAGIYAATWSIAQLASPFVQGAGNAMGPLLARRYADGSKASLVAAVRRFTTFGIAVASLYVIVMYVVGPPMMRLIYGEAYGETTLTLMLLACSIAISATALIATKVISVLEFPQINFLLNSLGLLMTCGFAASLGLRFQVEGAAAGMLIAAAIGFVLKWACYAWVLRR